MKVADLQVYNTGERRVWFTCPGCKEFHAVRVSETGDKQPSTWAWNLNEEKPTFEPSILVRSTHGPEYTPVVCHSFVRDGRIQFLDDCTHALAGQTVDLPEWTDD